MEITTELNIGKKVHEVAIALQLSVMKKIHIRRLLGLYEYIMSLKRVPAMSLKKAKNYLSMNLLSFDQFEDSHKKRFTLKYLHGLVFAECLCV